MLDLLGRALSATFFPNPILVVGTGRSGTSVLLQALGRHPAIFDMPGEAPYLTSVGSSAYLFEGHADHRYYLESLKPTKAYFYDQLRRLAFEVSGGPHFALKLLVKRLLERGRSPLGRRWWCAKTFPERESTEGLLALYPRLKVIYIVRNGCDVVQSMAKFKGFSDEDFETHCRRWTEGVEKYRYLLTLPQALVVTHESLLGEPEAFFTRVLDFLGLPQHPGPAHYAKTTVVHPLDMATKHAADPKAELAARQPAAATWTSQQKALFERLCGTGMRELGYEVPR